MFTSMKQIEVAWSTTYPIHGKLNGTRTPVWKNSEKYFLKNSESFFSFKTLRSTFSKLNGTRTPSKKLWKFFFLKTLRSILSKLWEVLSQNSMASERHPKKLWKFFFPQNSEKYFLKTLRSISQNSTAPERHSKKLWKFFFFKTLRSIFSNQALRKVLPGVTSRTKGKILCICCCTLLQQGSYYQSRRRANALPLGVATVI